MILIDYKDRRPIYEQVSDKLRDLMLRGILEQDSQLPSVRSLATDLSINPNTIQRAYTELERQGFIYSVKGRGSFVSANTGLKDLKKKEICGKLEILVDDAKSIGITMVEFQECVMNLYGSDGKGKKLNPEENRDETVPEAVISGNEGKDREARL